MFIGIKPPVGSFIFLTFATTPPNILQTDLPPCGIIPSGFNDSPSSCTSFCLLFTSALVSFVTLLSSVIPRSASLSAVSACSKILAESSGGSTFLHSSLI